MDGGPGRSRTADLRFRKPTLYPSELRGHFRRNYNILQNLVYTSLIVLGASGAQWAGIECQHGIYRILAHGFDINVHGSAYVGVPQDRLNPLHLHFDSILLVRAKSFASAFAISVIAS